MKIYNTTMLVLFTYMQRFIYSPMRLLGILILAMILLLFMDGTFMRLWSLNQDQQRLQTAITELDKEIKKLDLAIAKAQKPAFIEDQARERFQLAQEEDLIFIFPD